MNQQVCGRIHLGPINEGEAICPCCGKIINCEERIAYWRTRAAARQIIVDAQRFISDYVQTRRIAP